MRRPTRKIAQSSAKYVGKGSQISTNLNFIRRGDAASDKYEYSRRRLLGYGSTVTRLS
jgi:hypothetical protein